MTGTIIAVARSPRHGFSKVSSDVVRLVEGLGVEGDAHAGVTVKHRSRVARNPGQPNLRQVHLLHAELLDELDGKGFRIGPGQIGENILTRGIDLLALPTDTILRIGSASIRVTGLRNPCMQLDRFQAVEPHRGCLPGIGDPDFVAQRADINSLGAAQSAIDIDDGALSAHAPPS